MDDHYNQGEMNIQYMKKTVFDIDVETEEQYHNIFDTLDIQYGSSIVIIGNKPMLSIQVTVPHEMEEYGCEIALYIYTLTL